MDELKEQHFLTKITTVTANGMGNIERGVVILKCIRVTQGQLM